MWIKPGPARHERPAPTRLHPPSTALSQCECPILSSPSRRQRRSPTQVRARPSPRHAPAPTRYGHAGATVEERPLSGCR
jgi:hypothetical protein